MAESRGDRLMSLFLAAVELPDADRAGYLDGVCGDDPALRAEVESLLNAHQRAGEFLGQPTMGPAPAAQPSVETVPAIGPEPLGTSVGLYRLMQRLGEGGFGEVFLAEQTEPVRRDVALKIIKAGMDTRAVIARFQAERQALAVLDHPNIAKVFDAGTTPSGRLYFVMELVRGVPITEYCDSARLGPRERLELFIPVCQAVQHAHQKGIIHRDLKPSNILVAQQDGRPVPKVIDFGIAKAVGTRLTDQTIVTEFRQLIGTPAYMSPEQAGPAPDIDTRTDVYSLGVLLYELLTGLTPFDSKTLAQAAAFEVQRIIREVDPPRPSDRVSTVGNEATELAHKRRTEPASLSKTIRGELDWIVMKCLDKDRVRRYDSAAGLSEELRRYLNNEAVIAGPPGTGYRVRKFVRRNRRPIAAAVILVLTLIAGIIGTSLGFWSASRERDDAIVARANESTAKDAAKDAEAKATRERDQARFQAYLANVAAADAAIRINEISAAHRRLDSAPQELRNWEWRYASSRADRSILSLRGHKLEVTWAGFSPEGTKLLTGSWDGLRTWDAQRGGQESLVPAFGPIAAAKIVRGKWMVLGRDGGSIRLWDGESGAVLHPLPGRGEINVTGCFAPDGGTVAFSNQTSEVALHDTASGTEVRRFKGHTSQVLSVCFSHDGARVAAGAQNGSITSEREAVLLVWDVGTGDEVLRLKGAVGTEFGAAAFSPDDARIAAGSSDGTIRTWDIATKRELWRASGHSGSVTSLLFSPDGRTLISGSADTTVRLWNCQSGEEVQTLRGHSGGVTSLDTNKDGSLIISGSLDGQAKLWDTSASTDRSFAADPSDRGYLAGFALSPDGRMLAACRGVTVHVLDAATGGEIATLMGPR